MDLFPSLNDKQREAVQAFEGPLLILAGAGTGKTMALTCRIAYLIHEKHVDPQQIMAVTFTNKAAREMKERIKNLLGVSDQMKSDLPTIGTFHSICVQILRREIHHLNYESDFVIYDSVDSLALIRRVMKELQISDKQFNPKAIKTAISAAKNVLQTYEDVQGSAMNRFQQKVALVYEYYQKSLMKMSVLDFDDLIMNTVLLFEKNETLLKKYQQRWKYIHVDEYQDTNMTQYRLIQLLAEAHHNLCVVGDPDQNIYSWRGADITNILQFSKEYPESRVIKLEQNYRSTPHILAGAEALVAQNSGRIEKSLWTKKTDGEKIQMIDLDDERAEAAYVIRHVSRYIGRLREHVVLYRMNAQSRVLEEACLRGGIPYRVVGGVKFYARKEIKDMLAYLRLIQNTRDDASLLRIINVPSRKIGVKTIQGLQNVATLYNVNLFEAIKYLDEGSFATSKLSEMRGFVRLIEELQVFSRAFPVSALIREILSKINYDKILLEEKEIGQARLENVEELISVAKKYDDLKLGAGLSTFLEEVALLSDTDELQDRSTTETVSDDYLTLMTVHSAKGLEFRHVYMVGLEEGIFPHSRSAFDPEQLEEERRLMYVAMTRAQEYLTLMWARRRLIFGETQYNSPSSFLKCIPQECLDEEYAAQSGEESMVGRLRDWGRGNNEDRVVFSDEDPYS